MVREFTCLGYYAKPHVLRRRDGVLHRVFGCLEEGDEGHDEGHSELAHTPIVGHDDGADCAQAQRGTSGLDQRLRGYRYRPQETSCQPLASRSLASFRVLTLELFPVSVRRATCRCRLSQREAERLLGARNSQEKTPNRVGLGVV